jgi:hypothetical protein
MGDMAISKKRGFLQIPQRWHESLSQSINMSESVVGLHNSSISSPAKEGINPVQSFEF